MACKFHEAKEELVEEKEEKKNKGNEERKEIRVTVRRGQVGIGNLFISIFFVVLIIAIFIIVTGFLDEIVVPELELNETTQHIDKVFDKTYQLGDLAVALVMLLAVFTILMYVINYIRRATE